MSFGCDCTNFSIASVLPSFAASIMPGGIFLLRNDALFDALPLFGVLGLELPLLEPGWLMASEERRECNDLAATSSALNLCTIL